MFRLPHKCAERLVLILCCLAALVSGCSQTPNISEPVSQPQAKEDEPVEYGQFSPETLYALLVAELAADRNRFDISLGNYSQQAHKTRDPAIAERATYLAGYLGARQATLSNAMLWTQIDPENVKARLIYANELSQLGKLSTAFAEALPLLENALDAKKGSAAGLDIFQSIAAKAKGLTASEQASLLSDYDAALKKYPGQAELMVGKGLLLSYQGNNNKALKVGQAVLKKQPDHVGAVTLTTQSLQQLNRSAEAIQLFERLLKQNPDNHEIRARYARALITIDRKKAKQQFIKLHEIAPNNPDHLFALSLICLDQQAYNEAKRYLTKLLQQSNPDHQSAAHYYLGEIAAMKDEPSIALEHYKSVGPGTDFVSAINKTVRLLFMANNSEKVGDYFDELRQKYAYLSERLFLIEAQILQQYQQIPLSLSILEQGLATFPESVSLLFSRAMAHGSLGNEQHMEADLADVIKQDENHAPALNALGYAWADKAIKLEEAKALITRALALRPSEAAYIDSMGWVEYRLGRFESAIKQLNKAMKLQPDHEIAAHLGEVLWVTGQTEAAYAAWQKGLSIKPGSNPVKNTVLRLTGRELPPSLTVNDTKKAAEK